MDEGLYRIIRPLWPIFDTRQPQQGRKYLILNSNLLNINCERSKMVFLNLGLIKGLCPF